MKELKLTRVPPGDRWANIDSEDDQIEENGAEVDRLVGSLPKAQVLSKLN
jgi:hypothetical protein